MEHLFFECSIRGALLFAGTAIVLCVMRVRSAAARHSFWAVMVQLMLVLPIWTGWGPKASLRVLPPFAQKTANEAMTPISTLSIAFLPSSPVSTLQAVLLGFYLLGLCSLLLRLAIGTVRARRMVRDAVLHDGVRTSSLCATPVTVGFFHPTVILPEHWRQWAKAQLDAVLTHEYEHARRRDSLVQWLALLNRALFWFHPVAWWLERHLSALAEEACDDVVLACGHDPREYSEYLIYMARSVRDSGGRVNIAGMAMPGSFLRKRIRTIIEGGPIPPISRTRMACIAVICTITCAAFASGKLVAARQRVPEQSTTVEHEPSGLEILTPHEGVDFTAFSSHLLQAIKRNWLAKIPEEAKRPKLEKGKVVVRFRILKSGALEEVPMVEASSGNQILDNAAVAAVSASAPFERVPESFKGPNIELRLMFLYNMPVSALNR